MLTFEEVENLLLQTYLMLRKVLLCIHRESKFNNKIGRQSPKTKSSMQSSEKLCLKWNDFQENLDLDFSGRSEYPVSLAEQRVAILLVKDNVNMFDSRTPSFPQAVIDADVDNNY